MVFFNVNRPSTEQHKWPSTEIRSASGIHNYTTLFIKFSKQEIEECGAPIRGNKFNPSKQLTTISKKAAEEKPKEEAKEEKPAKDDTAEGESGCGSDPGNNNNKDNNSKDSKEKITDLKKADLCGGSFKNANAAKSREVVEKWIQRALDMGVPALIEEFKQLAKWKPEDMTTTAFTENKDKNRYLDVPCGDNNRVKVNWPGLDNDYIHGNYIATPNSEKRLICTQGPLDKTQLTFWAMVVEQEVENIIMLCNTVECGKIKCSEYWPREKNSTVTFGEADGKIKITNMEVHPLSDEDPFIRISKLQLEFQSEAKKDTRIVRHYQWENWPDRGVPPAKLSAVNLLAAVRGTDKPIVVHCSAGIGRTGTIAAIVYVQERMRNGQCCLGMNELLKELRTQRPFSIQNEAQYIYLHRVLLAYFLEKYKSRFQNCLTPENQEKYQKWCADYKATTGCE